MTFREQLKMIRRHKGLTQKEVADAAGISHSFYSKFEKGVDNANPSFDKIQRILKALEAKLIIAP